MLRIEMLPADHGDALLIEYGTARTSHRILIDAGPSAAYEALRQRLLTIPAAQRDFELLVVTHVDGDHIEGVVRLLQDSALGLSFRDVWFNDWQHIEPLDEPLPADLGVEQGEFLSVLLDDVGITPNAAFGYNAVMVGESDLPEPIPLRGGAEITLLAPGRSELLDLRREWDRAIRAAGFIPGDRQWARKQFGQRRWAGPPRPTLGDEAIANTLDHSVANRSSIAFLLSFDGATALLTGDGDPVRLRTSLELVREDPPVPIDAFKVPHHGSRANMTPQLLEIIAVREYLVSTSGARYLHPHRETIDLIVQHHNRRGRPSVRFNYRSPTTEPYAVRSDLRATYPRGSELHLWTASESE